MRLLSARACSKCSMILTKCDRRLLSLSLFACARFALRTSHRIVYNACDANRTSSSHTCSPAHAPFLPHPSTSRSMRNQQLLVSFGGILLWLVRLICIVGNCCADHDADAVIDPIGLCTSCERHPAALPLASGCRHARARNCPSCLRIYIFINAISHAP